MTAMAWCVGLAWACSGAPQAAPPRNAATPSASGSRAAAAADPFVRGVERLRASDYVGAEADLRRALVGGSDAKARLALARLLLTTGRYPEALAEARALGAEDAGAAGVALDALTRLGRLDEALAVLMAVRAPRHPELTLRLGEVLLELGRRAEAEPVLMELIDAHNARGTEADPEAAALVGRAAHLLRSPRDANDAFNQAEQIGDASDRTLLWRSELFLEKYDPVNAKGALDELLARAPNHPDALVLRAEVKLQEALDFRGAKELARRALEVDAAHARAHFVLGGVALRDMDLEQADAHIARGLASNPRQLELLSLRAAARFLGDDAEGFEAAKARVLTLNPEYSRLFQIVGEYAEWEHRYDEIVAMMREAILVDNGDAKARAQLGLNLIRSGNDEDGVRNLQRAFALDPFNVRVYNTLNLYEKRIPERYVTVAHGRFRVRYHKEERALLERYVPELLERAWDRMVEAYGFTPATPVGIELYAERESFAVRTSGLPNTAIQGVCFGRTLASMSPMEESFNLGMTLWHELAHVFHIQLSRSHVPRWFTEGLAEHETIIARPEWRRELDADLYRALQSGRLPRISAMNEAFSHADSVREIATAYYASSQIVGMLYADFGPGKLADMLRLWGGGVRTEEVVERALGVSTAALDERFQRATRERLAHFAGQFMPPEGAPALDEAKRRARARPKDVGVQTDLARAALAEGALPAAEAALDDARALAPEDPVILWISARLHATAGRAKQSLELLERLTERGHDGYAVRIALAELYEHFGDGARRRESLERARTFDPTQAEPLVGLLQLAKAAGETSRVVELLRRLSAITEHDSGPPRELLRLLLEQGAAPEAVTVGEAAIYADLEGLETHRLFARALAATGDHRRAAFEYESAALCSESPATRVALHREIADYYRARGRRADASRHETRADAVESSAPPAAEPAR